VMGGHKCLMGAREGRCGDHTLVKLVILPLLPQMEDVVIAYDLFDLINCESAECNQVLGIKV
jgi:hypothetical protein